MKIALASDIHLEFGDINLQNQENAEVLILSGDICTAKVFKKGGEQRKRVIDFFKRVSFQFPQIVYVVGNHEHYDYDIAKTYRTLKDQLTVWPNIHILEKETWTLDDVTFVGATLWTDMNKDDSLTKWHCGQKMNDFQLIKNSNRKTHHKNVIYVKNPDNSGTLLKDANGELVIDRVDHYEKDSRFSVEDSIQDHDKAVDYIKIAVGDKSKKFVVCTHHAPTFESVAEWYKHDTLMNGAFASDLSDLIIERPQIKLWTHGHMHNMSNYWVGDTQVVCNPRGYIGYESGANFFQLKYLEV